ncbi:hypothetical protein R1flu_021326 [Riccia fluitans]|uniref:Reverse transcriptase domain-containing protein n=1 Tax=Riccia fluitans TaxID=41844 RepID=A0ABD1ZP10_9MARC
MTKEVFSHFSATFAHPSDLSCAQDQDGFLQVFAGKVSMEQAALMDDLPTLQEFTDVLCSSTKGKAPGFDGFNLDALRFIWDFVGPSYGFIVGRSLQNNVLEFALLHEAFKRERRSASFLLLDFAKAFDSLRHDFVLKGIAALGFSGSFVRIISSLLEGGFARVIFN